MKRLLFFTIVRLRCLFSPLIYWSLRFTIHKGKLPDLWVTARELPMEEFSNLINEYPYKLDYFRGALDNTLREPNFFFVIDRKSDRDCDDFAQMWFWWAKHKNYEAYMVAIADNLIRRGHKICIFKRRGVYYLADYTIIGEFNTLEQAIGSYNKLYPNLNWAITRVHRSS